ncbi:membrane protein [Rhodopirellula maiorica SM1]|uniref:Membrane protein n=1 Tax=Rhodopirellula maiorica SM1 TaxID=1265738 RepID=M5RTN8_9BACT|nr:membrane protein [Rhodopirellula maiorica SM1]
MLVLAVFMTARTAIWEARYTAGNGTCIIQLPETAIWAPPSIPAYSEFAATFDHLPQTQPPNSRIYRLLKWDWMLLELLFYCLGSFVLVAPLYWLTRRANPDPVLHVTTWIGIGMTGSAVVCLVLWLAFGGWGPPAPLFLVSLGCSSALLLDSLRSPKRRRTTGCIVCRELTLMRWRVVRAALLNRNARRLKNLNTRFAIRTILILVTIAAVVAAFFAARHLPARQDDNSAVNRFYWHDYSNGVAKQRRESGWEYQGKINGLGSCVVLHHSNSEHEKYGQHGGYAVAFQLPLDVVEGDQLTLLPIPATRSGELHPHDRRFTLMLPNEFTATTFGDHFGSITAGSDIRESSVAVKKMTNEHVILHVQIDVSIPEYYDLKLDRDFTIRRVPSDDA